MLFLDLAKAFDCINHAKNWIDSYSIRGTGCRLTDEWIKKFLHGKSQQMFAQNALSLIKEISHCWSFSIMNQGSILGPPLYMLMAYQIQLAFVTCTM